MKFFTKLFGLIITLFYCSNVNAQNKLTLNIINIKSVKGNVEIGIFNKAESFLSEKSQYLKKIIKVNSSKISHVFNVPNGNYAIAVFHDENGNGMMDKNFVGMPKEPYGFSNNFKPTVSAPKFHQTKFEVNGNKTINITLID